MSSKYDLKKIRDALANAKGSKRDSNEFVPNKAKPGAPVLTYRFFVLPPIAAGDPIIGGPAEKAMELFYVKNGSHWINKRPHSCPRIHNEEDCDMCSYGFDLMGEVTGDGKEAKQAKSAIARNYLPPQRNAVNIYFPKDSVNPEELWGRVMWFNAPKTVIDVCDDCLNRDDAGDPEDPKAFGIFYDEDHAFLFQLTVGENGGYNDYKQSKFLPTPRPILSKPELIQKVLAGRHNLYSKFEAPDHEKLRTILKQIVNKGANEAAGSGFDVDETGGSAPITEDVAGEGNVEQPKPQAPKQVTQPPKPQATTTTKPQVTKPAPAATATGKPTTKPVATKPAPTPKPEPVADVITDETTGDGEVAGDAGEDGMAQDDDAAIQGLLAEINNEAAE